MKTPAPKSPLVMAARNSESLCEEVPTADNDIRTTITLKSRHGRAQQQFPIDLGAIKEKLASLSESLKDLSNKIPPSPEDGKVGKDAKSRPPSPPHSGTTTPRLRIGPCPSRLRSLIPPPNYGAVSDMRIFRGSFPQDRNIDFMKTLRIRNILTFVDTEPTSGYQMWIDEHRIKRTQIDIATNKNNTIGTTTESLCRALLFLLDSTNYPVMIHCNQGKHRTGVVVGCLRRIQRWNLKDIITEYETYASPKAREGDIKLISTFNPDCVFDYAFELGYVADAGVSAANATNANRFLYLDDEMSTAPLRRLDSTIINIDMLASALQAGAADPNYDSDEDYSDENDYESDEDDYDSDEDDYDSDEDEDEDDSDDDEDDNVDIMSRLRRRHPSPGHEDVLELPRRLTPLFKAKSETYRR